MERFGSMETEERRKVIWQFKEDWYDLDHLYLKKHPHFRAFLEYERAKDFRNAFMEEFAEDAFENRRVYITGFYRAEHENLQREYPYLDERTMDAFVAATAQSCAGAVKEWMGE